MADGFAAGLVGITLDERYRLDALLGEGGMGAVYRATHLAMDRKVAVKLLKPHLTTDASSLQRFAREARSTLKVDSPHAVKVLDFGVTPLRDYYMVLEYLDGRTVQRELEVDGPFAPARVVHIARHALHALGAAHARGLVHRDVKPDNILLMRVGDDPDFAKILDFGVAKLMEGAAHSDQSMLSLTAIGTVFGTPEFMSPEQACGHPLDGRSDLYSLGATMFAMLTGCALFDGKSAIEWLTHHARTPPPHLAVVAPDLAAHPELDELLQRCLAKQRELRPRDAAEMNQLLAALEPGLRRGPDKPGAPTGAVSMFSRSAYFDALPDTLVPVPSATAPSSTSTTGVVRELRSRRNRWLVLALCLAVGFAAAMIVLAFARRGSRSASISSDGSAPARRAATAAPDTARAPAPDGRSDAGVVVAVPGEAAAIAVPGDAVVAEVSADAGARAVPGEAVVAAGPADAGAAATPAPDRGAGRRRELERLLREAEQAARDGNVLKQMGTADLAVQLDPGHPRARFLFADALLKNGNLTKGCSYLRQLRQSAAVRKRARDAGCPAP